MPRTPAATFRLIAGGQTGVDQAALRAAQDHGLPTGGWCPPGRACEVGRIPARFPLRETPQERSADAADVPRSLRTAWNVRDSDATLVLQPPGPLDAGTAWTVECARRAQRPSLLCDPTRPDAAHRIASWLASVQPRVLNVAGPSEATAPGIGARVGEVLSAVFSATHPHADLQIRPARSGEAAVLTALARASKAVWGYPPELFDAWSATLTITPESIDTQPTAAAWAHGRLAGVHQLSCDAAVWELEHFWVEPSSMRRGVGRRLLTRALDHVATSGGATLHIDADPNAEGFYVACGAVRVGTIPAPIPGQPDRTRVELRLATGVGWPEDRAV